MVRPTTLSTLAKLEQEMARAGRVREEEALREARDALADPRRRVLTTGQAAERLGVSVPTVKRWIERGVLTATAVGNRWRVAPESVDRLVRLRESLQALDEEGNPSPEEVRALFARPRHASG